MAVDARQSKLARRSHPSLLGFQQYAQAGARDVFETEAVERHRSVDLIEKSLRRWRLGGVQPPGNDDNAVPTKINREHPHSLQLFRGRKSVLPPVFSEM